MSGTVYGMNPWRPMTDTAALRHLGKLAEEASELTSAVARCIIQGICEVHPVTGKPNSQWLEEEIADVLANIKLTTLHFGLDANAIIERAEDKIAKLGEWHTIMEQKNGGEEDHD